MILQQQLLLRALMLQQLQAEQTGSSFNGEEYVIGVVLKAVSTNQGGLRSMIKGVATT